MKWKNEEISLFISFTFFERLMVAPEAILVHNDAVSILYFSHFVPLSRGSTKKKDYWVHLFAQRAAVFFVFMIYLSSSLLFPLYPKVRSIIKSISPFDMEAKSKGKRLKA